MSGNSGYDGLGVPPQRPQEDENGGETADDAVRSEEDEQEVSGGPRCHESRARSGEAERDQTTPSTSPYSTVPQQGGENAGPLKRETALTSDQNKAQQKHEGSLEEAEEETDRGENPGGVVEGQPVCDEHVDSSSRLGDPTRMPEGSEPLTPEDQARLDERKREQEQKRMQDALEAEMGGEMPQIALPSFLWHPLMICFLLLGAGLLALFVVAQASSIIVTLASMPSWAAWVTGAALALLLTAVLYASGRLVVAYVRLCESPNIQLEALEKLSERQDLRRLANKKLQKAKDRLRAYVRNYPLDEELGELFGQWGVEESEIKNLILARDRLVDSRRRKASDEWIEDYKERFQSRLDTIAAKRISRWARRVGVKTAALPYPMADTLVACYCSYEMLSDLCRVYNVRFGRWNTVAVLVYTVWITLIAGGVDELEGEVEEGFDWAADNLPTGAVKEGMKDMPGLGKLFSKLAAGTLNALLLRRLGKRCQQLLRPVDIG